MIGFEAVTAPSPDPPMRGSSPAAAHRARTASARCRAARPRRPARCAAQPRGMTSEMRAARMCYDHLTGMLGVAVTDALTRRGDLAGLRDAFGIAPEWPEAEAAV